MLPEVKRETIVGSVRKMLLGQHTHNIGDTEIFLLGPVTWIGNPTDPTSVAHWIYTVNKKGKPQKVLAYSKPISASDGKHLGNQWYFGTDFGTEEIVCGGCTDFTPEGGLAYLEVIHFITSVLGCDFESSNYLELSAKVQRHPNLPDDIRFDLGIEGEVLGVAKTIMREMREDDLHRVERLDSETFSEPYPYFVIRQIFQCGTGVVAEVNREFAGYAIGLKTLNNRGYIATLCVSEKFRGKGVGRSLLREILTQLGTESFVLETEPVNTAFYALEGFEDRGLREDFYGPGKDRIVMVKEAK